MVQILSDIMIARPTFFFGSLIFRPAVGNSGKPFVGEDAQCDGAEEACERGVLLGRSDSLLSKSRYP